jgi:hypothetical protein
MMVGVARGKSAIATATWILVIREETGMAGATGVPKDQESFTTAAVLVDDRGPTLGRGRGRPRFETVVGMTIVDGERDGEALLRGLLSATTEENGDA